MKIKFLKIWLPIVFGLGTIASSAIILSSCTKGTSLDQINPIQTRSRNYQELFPNFKIEEFKNSFNSKSGIDYILNTLKYNPNAYQYVNQTLKINGTEVRFWISDSNSENRKIYEITLFNFYNKNDDPSAKFAIGENKLIPKNIVENQFQKIRDFKFKESKQINLSNLKNLQGKEILINKSDALKSPIVIEKMENYKTNILDNVLNDIDGGVKLEVLNAFNKSGYLMSSNNLFYYKDVKLNNNTNKLEGNVYIQIKNNMVKDLNIELFNKKTTIPASQYLTISLELNSDIEVDIFNIMDKNFLGFNLTNTIMKSEILNNNIEQNNNNNKLSITRSNNLNTEVIGVSLSNDLFNQETFLSNQIQKLNTEFFINSLREQTNNEFRQLKDAIINGISILELIANVDITLEDVLKGIGDQVAKILEMAKVDKNIINIVKNLLNAQTTSDFLYNSFQDIIAILEQNGANVVGSTPYYIKDFLIQNLGAKTKDEFIYFISNLKNLKDTIKKFVMAIEGLEPSSVSTILSLVDSLSENTNIITFLSNNINVISNLLRSLLPKEQSIIVSAFDAISKIEVNGQKANLLKDKFWNLATNTNTNIKTILTNLLVEISNNLPTSENPQGNLLKDALIWVKNLLDTTSIAQNFTPQNIVDVLNSLLNRKPDGTPLVAGGETTKQYFENNFVLEIPEQQSLNFDNVTQLLNGEFQYVYKFTKTLNWDMTKFQQVFYEDGFKLFSTYANWWYDQTRKETNSDKKFLYLIGTLSQTIGTALAPNRSAISWIPNIFGKVVKNLKTILLEFIDINNSNLTQEQKDARNKANFKLLFETNLTDINQSFLNWISTILPIKIPIADITQLSMTINNETNVRQTYDRYWKFIFGSNKYYSIPANSSFVTKNVYQNAQVYPSVDKNGIISWRTPSTWNRNLKGMEPVFEQSSLSRVLLAVLNPNKSINSINNETINVEGYEISKKKLANYSNDVANLNYKLVLNTKNVELKNKLFNLLKTSYKNSIITPEIQNVLNELFNVVTPSNTQLLKPTYFIVPNDQQKPIKYSIQLFFPTNLLIVDKENENLNNKTVEFNNFYIFDLEETPV